MVMYAPPVVNNYRAPQRFINSSLGSKSFAAETIRAKAVWGS